MKDTVDVCVAGGSDNKYISGYGSYF